MASKKDSTGLPVFKVLNDDWFNLFHDTVVRDRDGMKYRQIGHFFAIEPGDESDGTEKVHVICDEAGQFFGFFYFEMYNGETSIEYNGEQFGLDGTYDDPDSYFGYYVYERVREFAITGYQRL